MKPALILIDIQQGFEEPYWGERNNPDFEENISTLLAYWRKKNGPVIHVKHNSTTEGSPLRPELPGNAIYDFANPIEGEPLLEKNVNSAFIGTNLADYLATIGNPPLVIVGMTSDQCVNTTVRMAGNLGYESYMVSDATATFNKTDHNGKAFSADQLHEVALASIHEEFAKVISTKDAQKLCT